MTGAASTDWPLTLRGVTETVVTTPTGDGRHRLAALGIHAGDPVQARTYAGSQTHANLHARGRAVVHFTRDPGLLVEAALGDHTLESATVDAPARVTVSASAIETGQDGDTDWTEWALNPATTQVRSREIPRTERALAAVVEAAVAVSRLSVPGADRKALQARIETAESVVASCGDQRARAAMRRLHMLRADRSAESNGL